MERAKAGQKIDDLLDEIAELQRMIDASPTETLQDAAVKLRRLSAYVEDVRPMRLLSGALEAVEKAAEVA
jgi:DNA-binding ferritin-like protein